MTKIKDKIEELPVEVYKNLKPEISRYKYKNLTLLTLSLVFVFILSRNAAFHNFVLSLGSFSYLGAFVAGIFFVSTFTVATGGLVLLILARSLDPIILVIVAASGALIGDLLLFRFLKNGVTREVENLYNTFGGKHLNHILHSQYFHWTLPVIGALIIASPLPDEIGVSLMGISRMKISQFAASSFIFNLIGIFTLVLVSRFVKF